MVVGVDEVEDLLLRTTASGFVEPKQRRAVGIRAFEDQLGIVNNGDELAVGRRRRRRKRRIDVRSRRRQIQEEEEEDHE